uniref:Uncharacterized protein n=1 Tax=Anguilla anguilla TaxID=7936 RepID=A0A0E9TST9_ANGAN
MDRIRRHRSTRERETVCTSRMKHTEAGSIFQR